jgi:N-acetylglucosaminyldiphosphoundecaprenol N-acetyl-beta-D-mannosaminyltransferase
MLSNTGIKIIGTRVDATSYASAIKLVAYWAQNRESRYVCVANVHMVMEAHDSPLFRDIVNHADLVTPDGVPLVWMMRHLGQDEQERVYGPELTLRVVEAAALSGVQVGFYGGSPSILNRLAENLQNDYPNLQIVYQYSPPFRSLTEDDDRQIIDAINASGTRILFVGLGCPKQERWMAEHKGRVQAVMLGVGAAFDLYAGAKRMAPSWLQKAGLEWLFRLFQEPRRLWRRYLYHNPRFIALAVFQLIKSNMLKSN